MMLTKKYVGAYNQKDRDYFSLLPNEKKIVERLREIYAKEKGIFVLCGNRGAGKSSLKNISLEKTTRDYWNKPSIIVNVAFFSGNKDFYREILMQLPVEIINRLQEVDDSIGEIIDSRVDFIPRLDINKDDESYDDSQQYKLQNRLYKAHRDLKTIETRCTFSTAFKKVYENLDDEIKNLSKDFKVLDQQYGLRKQNFFSLKKVGKRKISISSLQRKAKQLEEKLEKFIKLSEEADKLYEFLQISQQQLKHFDVEITNTREYLESTTSEVSSESSIELSAGLEIIKSSIQLKDAVTSNESEQYVREYKSIITDELKGRQLLRLLKNMSEHFNITFVIDELDKCSTATIIEMIDFNKRLFLDCNVSVLLITDISTAISLEETSDYVTEANIVVVPDLSVLDYIYRINSKGIDIGSQFITILDSYFSHKMSNRELNYQIQQKNNHRFSKGFELYKFMNSCFYRDLNSLYKIIILKFYWQLLDLLDFVGELTEEEYKQFENKFYEQNELESLKVKFIIRKLVDKIRDQSFAYSFTLEDERSCYKQSVALNKFREISNDFYAFLEQLTLKPTIISDDTNFLKVNSSDNQIGEFNSFGIELSNYLQSNKIKLSEFREMLLQLSQSSRISIDNKMIRFADKFYQTSNGVNDARLVIERENTVGAILFYPYDGSDDAYSTHQPLRNGIIVTVNDFDEVVLYPYVGYIGLHSHKPKYLEELKSELQERNIPIYEVEDSAIWDDCFNQDNRDLEDKILEVCHNEIESWLKKLRNIQ